MISYSPQTNKSSRFSARSGNLNPKIQYFTNAIYIGTIKNQLRTGIGLTLYHTHLDYTPQFFAAITSFNKNGQYHGHNIFYGNQIVISAQFDKNRFVSIVYRIDGFLMFLTYNCEQLIDGECTLIDYTKHELNKIVYRDGKIIGKKNYTSQCSQQFLENVFSYAKLEQIIGIRHSKAINHKLSESNSILKSKNKPILDYNINQIKMKTRGNKVQVNYNNPSSALSKNHHSHKFSIGFSFFYRRSDGGYNPNNNIYEDDFELSLIEKGCYEGISQETLHLSGLGQKYYKNGNSYSGFFQNNKFQGQGVLQNPKKNSWVYGEFQNGELKSMLSNSDLGDKNQFSLMLGRFIQNKNRDNYNDWALKDVDFSFIDKELENILSNEIRQVQLSEEGNFENRKRAILKRIINNYIEEDNEIVFENMPDTVVKSNDKQPKKHKINHMITKKKLQQTNKKPDQSNLLKVGQKPSNTFVRYQENSSNRKEQNTPDLISTKNRISRIFNKSYDHLPQQNKDSMLKLYRVKDTNNKQTSNKKRKSKIFQNKIQNSQQKGFLLSKSAYQRRSKSRKTEIFNRKDSPNNKSLNQNFNQSINRNLIQTQRPTNNVVETGRNYQISARQENRKTKKNANKIFEEEGYRQINKDVFKYRIQSGHVDPKSPNEESGILRKLTNKYGPKSFGSSASFSRRH